MKKISFIENHVMENDKGSKYIILKECDFEEFGNVSEFILDRESKKGFRKYRVEGFGKIFSKEGEDQEIDLSQSMTEFLKQLRIGEEEADKFRYMYVKSLGYADRDGRCYHKNYLNQRVEGT